MSLGPKVNDLCEKLLKTMASLLKVEHHEILESKIGKIIKIISENTPLTAGFVLIELSSLLQEIDPNKHAELIKESYILSLEIALERFTDLAKAKAKERIKNERQ